VAATVQVVACFHFNNEFAFRVDEVTTVVSVSIKEGHFEAIFRGDIFSML
jgi:hypothetical protein